MAEKFIIVMLMIQVGGFIFCGYALNKLIDNLHGRIKLSEDKIVEMEGLNISICKVLDDLMNKEDKINSKIHDLEFEQAKLGSKILDLKMEIQNKLSE